MSSDSEYEEEEYLVYADFKNHLLPAELTAPNACIKIIGIESQTPMAEVNGNVFKGSYDHAMGTLVFFEKDDQKVETDPIYDEKSCKELYKIIGKTNKLNCEHQHALEQMLCEKMADPIYIKKFLKDYRKTLNQPMQASDSTFDIQSALNLPNAEQFKLLEEQCSLSQLKHPRDEPVLPYIPGVTELSRRSIFTASPEASSQLGFVKKLQEFKAANLYNPFQRSAESFKLQKIPANPEDIGSRHAELVEPFNDVILTVRFYRTPRVTHTGKKIESPFFAEEFECLGSNLLTELRDKIACICNKKRFFDISENPTVENVEKLTDPGFFFIGGTFYNDNRNPKNSDYSETIRNWAKTAPGLEKMLFLTANMEHTQFSELHISLGFPNLYMHHGNCEHVFTFSQLEVYTRSAACKYRQQYPRLRSRHAYTVNRLCHMCNRRHYNYVVLNSTRQPQNPSFLCGKCFHGYHYIDGKKIGEFQACRIIDYTGEEDEDADVDDDDCDEMESLNDNIPVIDSSDVFNLGLDVEQQIIVKQTELESKMEE